MRIFSFQIWLTILSLFVKVKNLFMNVMEISKFNIETSIYEYIL
jgi:hypothetical protein